jgi:hypothetical protein
MHGALLTLSLLVAITVDPRLEEPLRLLAEVRDRDGELVGAFYAKVPGVLTLNLAVRRLPAGMDARYDRGRRTVTVAEATMAESPRAVAAILVHKLRHTVDLKWVAAGAVVVDYLEIEARGFEAEAVVTRAFWPEQLPDSTDAERDLATIVESFERGGIADLRAQLMRDGMYEQQWAGWAA